MREPPCDSGDGVKNREHIGGEAHSSIDESTVEINIGIQFASNAK